MFKVVLLHGVGWGGGAPGNAELLQMDYRCVFGVVPLNFGGSHAGRGSLQSCGFVTSSCEQSHLFISRETCKKYFLCVPREEKGWEALF